MAKDDLYTNAYIVVYTFLVAFAVVVFIVPTGIACGGANGLSVLLYHIFHIDLGLSLLLVSVPLYALGIAVYGKKYGLQSVVGMISLSCWSTILGKAFGYAGLFETYGPKETVISVIAAAFLVGIGLGNIFNIGASTGGTDIIGQILADKLHLPCGVTLCMIDAVIVLVGMFYQGKESIIYSLLFLFMNMFVISFIGMAKHKSSQKVIRELV